jgi:hypothetical protein
VYFMRMAPMPHDSSSGCERIAAGRTLAFES